MHRQAEGLKRDCHLDHSGPMVSPGYYSSERFIQDELVRRAEEGIATLYDTWKRHRAIAPFVILWPATTIRDVRGIELEGPCLRELDQDRTQWRRQMVEAIKVTNAYALVLVQQRDDQVLVILESQHGAVSWVLPINRSGDVQVLGRAKKIEDGEHIGLLWRPTSQPS